MDGVEAENAVYEVSELKQQIEKLLTDKKGKKADSCETSKKRKASADECKNLE